MLLPLLLLKIKMFSKLQHQEPSKINSFLIIIVVVQHEHDGARATRQQGKRPINRVLCRDQRVGATDANVVEVL